MKSIKAIVLFKLIALAAVFTFAGCATNPGGVTATDSSEDHPYTDIPVPADIQTLAASLDWIGANAVDWGAYAFALKADETIQAQSLSYGDKRVSITLSGDAAGREVSLSGSGSLFSIERGVTLNVENLTLKGRGNSESAANDNALVRVQSGGVLKLKAGAVITENYNSANGGGGVKVEENSSLIMEGGAISGNTAKGGGGVQIRKGTFILEDGEISSNTAISGNSSGGGGGVEAWQGTFTMKGGTISGNSAGNWGGGGVRVDENVIFTMKGGEISGNSASNEGGGVRVDRNAAFIMEGGTISGHTSLRAGGVSVRDNAIFTMKGGEISGNRATKQGAGGVRVGDNSTFTMEGGEIHGNTALNDLGEGGGGAVNITNNGTFIMQGGTINGNTSGNGGGVAVHRGTFTMEGGEISGNTVNSAGGGVNVLSNAEFTMKGGTISGNTARSGGGVFVWEASFIKTGGTIYGDTDTTHTPGSSENTATRSGHAVWLHDGNGKRRNATADPEIKLYAKGNENDVWTYNDSSAGGVGDTTANWE